MRNRVLSIPASGTSHLIKEYRIHGFPSPRSYDYSNLVTFRIQGGVMEELYSVDRTFTLNMNKENINDHLVTFDTSLQDRIKGYIDKRKMSFGFERPEFMFWVLKKEKDLIHKPRTDQTYNSHVYYTYDEITSGKKRITIASKVQGDQGADLLSKFKDEFPQISIKDVINTEREQVIRARIGQSSFKQGLLQREAKCTLCSISDERLLIASHIKPWGSSDDFERLDFDNGLLLCPNHDWLFDRGYISFTDKGEILITRTLNELSKSLMNLSENMKIILKGNQNKYMRWHRRNLFEK